jgi:hypothetical protein
MLVMSIGMGLTFVPLTLTAVSGVAREDSGIASALLNTAQQVGGSLGLAILATVSASRADALLPEADVAFLQGVQSQDLALVARAADALTEGYARAFLVGTAMLVVALVLTVTAVNARRQDVAVEGAAPVHVG